MMEVIYKDQDIIAVNKPPGLVVFSEKEEIESVASLLIGRFPELEKVSGERKGAVHRLDKDTSGVVLFARNKKTLLFLQRELFERRAEKKYIALVFKRVKDNEKEIRTSIVRSPKDRKKQKAEAENEKGREAITFFRVIKRFANHTLLEVFPKTGRKHQIRCHLSFIGHPVAGDKLYRFKDQKDPEGLERQFLHAETIRIKTHQGEKTFRADLPSDLRVVLDKLSTVEN